MTTRDLLQRHKMKDSITIAVTGGLLGTVCMTLTNWLIYKAGKTEVLYEQITGQFFFSPRRTKYKNNFVLGELLHMGVGSFFGLPIFYILKKTRKDSLLLKGILGGMSTWGILYSGGQKIGLFKRPRLTKTHYSAVFNNLVYGVTAAQAMIALADPKVFASTECYEMSRGNSNSNSRD